MSLFIILSIKRLFELGRRYPFPRPPTCLKCGSTRIWGHGFKDAYFDGYDEALCLKRYRCADCGCVYTMRPFGYWPRHHIPVRVIFESLCHRIREGAWDKGNGLTRQRQGHWLGAFVRNIKLHLGISSVGTVAERFCGLIDLGRIPALRTG